ncbi:MAG: 16S rRNA (cytosine(967)-C(5))-methyltransferase RsmB [Gammaproteobacteria bacterium]|nr:16S rRNA (cytosine(967)-C(5))-methyltransferase RsmB [Gammaproteobacteria bacterium]
MSFDARAAAALVLRDVLAGTSLAQSLPERLRTVSDRDRPLVRQLVYGSLRMSPRLLAILAQLLDKPLRDKDRDVTGLLMVGIYQLLDTRIPDHAAVAATVDAIKALKKPWAKGLTNAILRRFLREQDDLLAELEPAAATAQPQWLYNAVTAQWPARAADIFAATSSQPPLTLRVNAQQSTRAEYLQQLAATAHKAHAGDISEHAIYLQDAVDVQALPGFAKGAASVQDEAAQVAASLLDTQPGERILDACAAPGGKACHIIERQPALKELVAMDSDAQRLKRVHENLQRLSLSATVIAGDASKPPKAIGSALFDRILIDAPCSATGVIRRYPDILLLRRDSDIAQFAEQQRHILAGLWPLLRPGGVLLYATCSILDEENSAVIRHFLDSHQDARLQPINVAWGEPAACGRQLLPTRGAHDGLFYSLLEKTT